MGKKQGRPRNDEELREVYLIDANIELDYEKVSKIKSKLGRFILATNDVNLDPDTILSYYKGQQSVERGFRFLKDKCFRVAEVYLKKEERIEALAMIMVLTLMIYSHVKLNPYRRRILFFIRPVCAQPEAHGRLI